MKMFKHLNHRSTFIQACHYQLCPTFIPGAGNDTATLVGIVQGYSYLVEVQDLGLSCWGDLLKVKCLPALVHHATQIFQRTKRTKSTGSKVSFSFIFTMNIRNQRRKLFWCQLAVGGSSCRCHPAERKTFWTLHGKIGYVYSNPGNVLLRESKKICWYMLRQVPPKKKLYTLFRMIPLATGVPTFYSPKYWDNESRIGSSTLEPNRCCCPA